MIREVKNMVIKRVELATDKAGEVLEVEHHESTIQMYEELADVATDERSKDYASKAMRHRETLDQSERTVVYRFSAKHLFVELPESEFLEQTETQKLTPVLMTPRESRPWWWYHDRFWLETGELQMEDLQALILKREREPDSVKKLEGGSDDQWHAVPIPTELHEAVTASVLTLADLLRQSAAARKAEEEAFEATVMPNTDEPRWMEKQAALRDLMESERGKLYALEEPILKSVRKAREAVLAVDDFFMDIDAYEMEERCRECAAATLTPGTYAVVLAQVTDLDDVWESEWTVRPYLDGRLGFTLEGAERTIKRAQHVSRETVLEGVDLDDAVRIKEELVSLGCDARVVEGRPRSTTGGGREPIPESVRHEVWRRDEGRCVDCGSRERLEFDHIIPVSQGGSNTARNIELRCESCNRTKAASI